jgi:hypothetical protein
MVQEQDWPRLHGHEWHNCQQSGENQESYWERMLSEFKTGKEWSLNFSRSTSISRKNQNGRFTAMSSQGTKRKVQPKGCQVGKAVEVWQGLCCLCCWGFDEQGTGQQPTTGRQPKEWHHELIKMIEGQSKSLYQFGLMLTSSTLSLAQKQAAIDHLLADLEEKKLLLEEWKLPLLWAAAKTKCPWLLMTSTSLALLPSKNSHPKLDLSELSDDGSNVDNNKA